jgi:putative ABC transport system permease protein
MHPHGLGLRYSLKSLAARLQTTAFALASLAVAVAMLIGITLMIGSFRETLRVWLETSLRADIFITAESWARGNPEAQLSRGLIDRLRIQPGVADFEVLRQFPAYTEERRFYLGGLATGRPNPAYSFPLLVGEPGEVFRKMREEGAVLITEPLARKEGLGLGDTLRVYGPAGLLGFPIVGISHDYTSEAGGALLHLDTLEEHFGPGSVNNLALYLEPGIDPERMVDELKATFRDTPLAIRSNRQLRAEVFDIFDQTFAITRILQGMALLIAACGVALTLLIVARERIAELALYRALGALKGQIFRIFLGEGLSIGILGLGLGLVGGVGLALILILIINRAYFGWTIQASWPHEAILQEVATILIASVLASIYPALRASRVPARELSRDDL